eukprot:CAMPEP_0202835000 /NCGR_PEP_ID=MMETSP1389-20130828/34763_1 /ASSEMBLY_ACC=CAM_ASM_000865 /TAXON_ID=302021 /ORGANISM="Rhodomonas sp., Strain CCMP768" /LENGTH=212 /DNA_ID=CAMNT_0049510361 /DNA_START=64 /DNA_END=699 /DNA_ORIENTATION=+
MHQPTPPQNHQVRAVQLQRHEQWLQNPAANRALSIRGCESDRIHAEPARNSLELLLHSRKHCLIRCLKLVKRAAHRFPSHWQQQHQRSQEAILERLHHEACDPEGKHRKKAEHLIEDYRNANVHKANSVVLQVSLNASDTVVHHWPLELTGQTEETKSAYCRRSYVPLVSLFHDHDKALQPDDEQHTTHLRGLARDSSSCCSSYRAKSLSLS